MLVRHRFPVLFLLVVSLASTACSDGTSRATPTESSTSTSPTTISTGPAVVAPPTSRPRETTSTTTTTTTAPTTTSSAPGPCVAGAFQSQSGPTASIEAADGSFAPPCLTLRADQALDVVNGGQTVHHPVLDQQTDAGGVRVADFGELQPGQRAEVPPLGGRDGPGSGTYRLSDVDPRWTDMEAIVTVGT